MTSTRWLSRVRIRPDAPIQALWRSIVPADRSERTTAAHRLLWVLFADDPDRERDFLWREAQPGIFYVLSKRVPQDVHGMFEIDGPREFAPSLQPGDRLRFALRVNATVSRGGSRDVRGKPADIVMDAIRGIDGKARASARTAALVPTATQWMNARGERQGFALRPDSLSVLAYETIRLGRESRGAAATIGVLDLEGELEVRDPDPFLDAVYRGFGRAKAFGNGLMLIRRA